MTTTEIVDKLVCAIVDGKTSLTFKSKDARKLVAARLRRLGYELRYSSIRNQRLHPQYVDDWEYDLDTGFGNRQYLTWFNVLYEIRVTRPSDIYPW